ncbi:MAG: glycosyltransferase family 9 protein [Ignavibacteria bacterium]|nr:glycosyltransferase family 9 protein [Ignavibacteria bacterium]
MDLQNPKAILIVQIGKIGDMILTTPLFSEIREIYPDSKLTVLASSLNKDIPLNHRSVDEVIVYKKSLRGGMLLLSSSLRSIDLWIDTKDNFSGTSALLIKIFKPKISLGFNFEKKIFDVSLSEYQTGKHAVDINLSPVNYLRNTKEKFNLRPSFEIPEIIQKQTESVMQVNPFLKKVLINVSAGSKSRYLQKEKWNTVINRIHQTNFYCFNLIGLEEDMEIIDHILNEAMGMHVQYIHTSSIIETAEIVKRNDFVISADTSIVHLCSAFNKPIVALYPYVKWNLEKFAPLSDIQEIIISGKDNSIEDIKADEIVDRFKKLVNKI